MRQSASSRGYTRAWQRLRKAILAERPVCQACGVRVAEEVDHIIALAKGGDNDPNNLQALCKPCHSRKTVACDGGFGKC